MLASFTRKPLAVMIATASLGLLSGNAVAAENLALEEIVVTAEKREATLQDTPISLAAFDDTALTKFGIDNMGDLEGLTPNLSITPFPNSRSSLVVFIRGIGNNDSQTTQDPAVGVYMDGVYIGRSVGLTTDVAALERIEVLRGPQGTLYGRNTTGGAINYVTAKPSQEFAFEQTIGAGNNDHWASKTTIDSGEVVDGLTGKLTYLRSHNGGWVENLGNGNDFGEEDNEAGRIALSFAATEALTVDYSYDFSEVEGPQQFYQSTAVPAGAEQAMAYNLAASGFTPESVAFYAPIFTAGLQGNDKRQSEGQWSGDVEDSQTKVSGHNLTVSYDLGGAVFKSITGYRKLDESIVQDYSGGPAEGFHVNVDIAHEQWSQEFQLVGDVGERLSYVAGLYYYYEEGLEKEADTAPGMYPIPGVKPTGQGVGFVSKYVIVDRYIDSENTAYAAYGQLTYTPALLDDRLDLTVGVRYTEDHREVEKADIINFPTDAAVKGKQTYSNTNPSFTALFNWTDDLSTYAKVVNGYKSGGFNARSTYEGIQRPFDEEELWSYEAGLKSMWLDNRLRVNAAVFYNDYENMQIQQITDNSKIFLTDVFNAGEATTQGIELDVTAQLTKTLAITANYAYLDADFDKVTNGNTGADVTADYTMPFAPEESYSLVLDHVVPLGEQVLRSTLNYNWRGVQYGTAANADMKGFEVPHYGLLNGRIALEGVALGENSGELTLALWGKNLTDEEYIVHSISQGVTHNGYFGEPRSYGLDLTYNY
ncbi:iron complex outermembrane receptor protein [Sinobacterium caligoides]|uniref:Iron complex outermembrane receptor protein n=1 Tax=Sinobacterium caligoides TaxID=933926 RepID=A0A3N2DYB4_9GAMM|nr:TonB-dependent receptor [Sinobacterium caligoides]ROS04850.1 iron complex outermembrane receptor protein [Sinobacterium caligoides]